MATDESSLPLYAPELDAYHRAHLAALRAVVAGLPISAGQRVLDMACGDGTYCRLLAERIEGDGLIVGADISETYLKEARDKLGISSAPAIEFAAARIEALPFPDDAFDLVWCAQSLISIPRPEVALIAMRRVVRPGGWVAIMETDSLHEVLLPWPAELELAIREAELRAYQAQTARPDNRYMARRLRGLLTRAGFAPVRQRTHAVDRWPPFAPAETEHFSRYLSRLRETVSPFLDEQFRSRLERLADPDSPQFMARQAGFGITWLNVVCLGQKPVR